MLYARTYLIRTHVHMYVHTRIRTCVYARVPQADDGEEVGGEDDEE